ncbi:sensor histidine kinase [Actinoplanes sp. NPDC051494]|uniref:sensor histidine kinase n=1 Tax=Actinoplanes sp. NPDC051494 TaxID=3363907 RepID=UPI0037B5FB21
MLTTIGRTGRTALAQVKDLIEMLRDEHTGAGSAELDRLVGAVRATGLDVRVDADPARFDELTPPVRLALLQVVQESLTNVLRHAGPDARATVAVTHGDGAVRVRVRDQRAGHGLEGMRERVADLGGSLSAGATPGGFVVEATVPRR